MRIRRRSGALRRQRFSPLLWTASAVAAAILALGVNGTLAQFTASITNNNNVVETHGPSDFGFEESLLGPDGNPVDDPTRAPCATAGAGVNATCSLINKYGETGGAPTPMEPGTTRNTTVRLTNIAVPDGLAGNLALVVDNCVPSVPVGTANPDNNNVAAGDICGTITVTVSCDSVPAFDQGPVTLTAFNTGGPTYAIATGIPPGGAVNCTFTTAMPLAASAANLQGLSASQNLTWTWTQST